MKLLLLMLVTGVLMITLAASAGTGLAQGGAPVGTAFTYQGRLLDGGSPANGTYDFEFKLYDEATAGSQVGSTVTKEDVAVNDGLFMVKLDFGPVFTGQARWLEIGVRSGDSTGAYTTLSPRQELTPVPYAIHATSATLALRLFLPYADSVTAGAPAFSITNTGLGGAGNFTATGPGTALAATQTSTGDAISAVQSGPGGAGTGSALFAMIANAANPFPAIDAGTIGPGDAIVAVNGAPAPGAVPPGAGRAINAFVAAGAGDVIRAETRGAGDVITAIQGPAPAGAVPPGAGRAINAFVSGGTGDVIRAETQGTGDVITAVQGPAPAGAVPPGAGRALNAFVSGGAGDVIRAETRGTGKAGLFVIANAANAGPAVEGSTSGVGGTGVFGLATSPGGITFGVRGQTASTANGATGVFGLATAGTGATRGVEGRTNSTTAGARGVSGIAAGATGATTAVYGNNLSAGPNAVGVEGIASAITNTVTYGGKFTSNSTNSNAAGVLAVGNGVSSPGNPQAAALEIRNGAVRVSGANQPAGKIVFDGPWQPIFSTQNPPQPVNPPHQHQHVIGCSTSETLLNDLITPSSFILLTPEWLGGPPVHTKSLTVHLENIGEGAAEVFVAVHGNFDCLELVAEGYVHYWIVNP